MPIELLTLPILGRIAWEDLRERSIHWWWLPLLAVGLMAGAWVRSGSDELLRQAIWNLCFLGLQLAGAALVMFLRHRDIRAFARSIGVGDLLFFVVVALGLPRADFILYLLSGLALCIPAYLLILRMRPTTTQRTVPLAGLLALYLAVWLCWPLTGLSTHFDVLAQSLFIHD